LEEITSYNFCFSIDFPKEKKEKKEEKTHVGFFRD
jgi:hypothetical protein